MSLSRAFFTVSSLTLVSRLTGLLREILIATTFGASPLTDAFNIAFRIPNSLRRLSAEGAFSQAFVPILSEFKNQKGERATRFLIDAVATILIWFLLIISVVGILFSSSIIYVVATGLSKNGDTTIFASTVWMTRVMFPYILLISLASFVSIILNTYQYFAIPSISPVLLNLSLIGSILFLVPYFSVPVYALAVAVLFGGVMQLVIQLPQLYHLGLVPRLDWCCWRAAKYDGVKRVFLKMIPATFAVSVSQISLLINTNIASRLAMGSVSWLNYADRLMELPTAVLGATLGTILLPNLSLAYGSCDRRRYSALLDWGLRIACLISIPSALALLFFPLPITATLFHYGRFSEVDVLQVSQTLVAYGIGLFGLIFVKILAPGFYASQNIRTPVIIALLVAFCTQLSNIILVPIFAHLALAISISFGAIINAFLLFIGLKQKKLYLPSPGWALFILKIISAGSITALTMVFFSGYFDWIALACFPMKRIFFLLGTLFFAAFSYFVVLFFLGLRLRDFVYPD